MGRAVVTLETLVDSVGGGVLELLLTPAGLEVAVGEIVIYDPRDQREIEVGDVVLGVGVDPGGRDAMALIERAGARGAAAVVLRLDVPAKELLDAAASAAVALMAVGADALWGHLHALLRTACAAAGAPGEVGPGGTPVGDLFALANAVSSMVGGATTIEDPRSTVLAYSSNDEPIDEPRRRTILGRRVPEDWMRRLEADGVFRRLWAGGVVRVDYRATDPDYRTRLAIAVRAGGEILGSIWVVEGERPLDERAEAALSEAGGIAALHLLRHRAFDDLERRRRADLLRSVLAGRTPPDVLAASLDVPLGSYVCVVAFELVRDAAATASDEAAQVERVVNAISVQCEAYRRQAATAAEGRTVYVLLPERTEPDADRLRHFASSILDTITDALNLPVNAGIGTAAEGFRGVLASRGDADRVLRTFGDESGRVAHIDDVRSQVVLLALRDLALRHPELRAGKLDRLVAADGSGVYIDTLRAYLDAFGDVRTAAARVGVHTNTFRYRLRRLAEIAELDVQDPAERLVAHLQLTFLESDGHA